MPETLPQFLYENSKLRPSKTAYRYKDLGVWQPTSWSEYFEQMRCFSMGLLALGLKKNDKVGIVGGNRAESFITMLAAQAVEAVSVAIYPESTSGEIAYQLNLTEVVFVVAEDQEQVDKILEKEEELPLLKKIIYFEPKGLWNYTNPKILPWEKVEELGEKHHGEHPDLFMELLERGQGDDIALICWTSGSTANPKAVIISHNNLVESIKSFDRMLPLSSEDDYLSMLPVAWMGEIILGLGGSVIIGYRLNFPESPDVAMENFREAGPTVTLLTVPALNSIVNNIQFKIMETSPLKRWFFNKALRYSLLSVSRKIEGKNISPGLKILVVLARLTCIERIRELTGLRRLKVVITGGAGLGPDIFKFVHAMGVPLRIVYGQSENTAFCTIHHDGDMNPDSVGRPLLGDIEVKVSKEGEILSRGPTIFKGYYKDPENTKQAIDADGWLHSGDAGEWLDDGQLVVIDRLKDLMKLNDGTRFSPQFIENKVKFSPFIQEAVVFGNEREYIAALVNIDRNVVGKWCEQRKIAYTTYSDISSNKEVGRLLKETIAEICERLPASSRIKKFVLLPKELDADDDELTRTKKVRRNLIRDRYHVVIDALFLDKNDVFLNLEIKYQDGRVSKLSTEIDIHHLY